MLNFTKSKISWDLKAQNRLKTRDTQPIINFTHMSLKLIKINYFFKWLKICKYAKSTILINKKEKSIK